jgi:outer membrane protein TolC
MKQLILVLCAACASCPVAAENLTLSLKQAVDLALRQNPDIALARLEEQRTALNVKVVKEPLLPRVFAGSGLAYSNGFPMSIEGSAPSIVEARAVRTLYSRPQGYQVAEAREGAAGATYSTAATREEVALRTATLFLDLEKATRGIGLATRQAEELSRVEALVRLRIAEGKEKEIEGRRAALNAARARQKVEMLGSQGRRLSASLAIVLGLNPADPILPASEERATPAMPSSEEDSVREALNDNPEIRKLESDLAAKSLQMRSFKAMRYPKIDLVAEYGLFAKFNNYTEYFRAFQRNNGEIGVSVSVPLFANAQDEAQAAQAAVDSQRIRTELQRLRGRVETETRQAWEEIREAGTANEVARMDLDLVREQVSLLLAQMEEGKATLQEVEEARYAEHERWMQLYEARASLERAQFQLLRQTRMLVAALR